MDIAQPIVGGGKERPPVKASSEAGGLLVRAVLRNTSQRDVNALILSQFACSLSGLKCLPHVEIEESNGEKREEHIFRPDTRERKHLT